MYERELIGEDEWLAGGWSSREKLNTWGTGIGDPDWIVVARPGAGTYIPTYSCVYSLKIAFICPVNFPYIFPWVLLSKPYALSKS